MKKGTCKLFVDGPKSRRIVDEKGRAIPLSAARDCWERGVVADCNLSFKRLATLANWDFDELERQFAAMDAARGK